MVPAKRTELIQLNPYLFILIRGNNRTIRRKVCAVKNDKNQKGLLQQRGKMISEETGDYSNNMLMHNEKSINKCMKKLLSCKKQTIKMQLLQLMQKNLIM